MVTYDSNWPMLLFFVQLKYLTKLRACVVSIPEFTDTCITKLEVSLGGTINCENQLALFIMQPKAKCMTPQRVLRK